MEIKEELSNKQKQLLGKISDEYLRLVVGGGQRVNLKAAKKGFDFMYARSGHPPPKNIVVCDGPLHLKRESGMKRGEFFDPIGLFHDASWMALANFFMRFGIHCGMENDLIAWRDFLLDSGVAFCVLREDTVYVCGRPKKVTLDEEGRPHSESGAAIEWDDGFAAYVLHGVVVPKEIVTTPGEKMTLDMLKEANAEVRKEIVRKMGIDRIAYLGQQEVLDAVDSYTLILLDIGDKRKREFLKMRNPSIGITHIEGVPPGTRTVQDALIWRNQTDIPPEVLT